MNGFFKLPNGLWFSEIDGTGPYSLSDGGTFVICGTQGSTVIGSDNDFFKLETGFWTKWSDGSGPYVKTAVGQFKLQSTGAGGGAGAVASVNAQTGVVVLTAGDVGAATEAFATAAADAKVADNLTASTTVAPSKTAVNTALALKANLASPTLTGTPLAPTAAPGTTTTQLATTAFAATAADAKVADNLTASTTVAPSKTAVNTGLALKTDYLAPVTINSSLTINAATHGNRKLNVSGADRVLTVGSDVAGGWVANSSIYAIPEGTANFKLAASGSTLVVAPGCSLDSKYTQGGVVVAEHEAATDTWLVTSPLRGTALPIDVTAGVLYPVIAINVSRGEAARIRIPGKALRKNGRIRVGFSFGKITTGTSDAGAAQVYAMASGVAPSSGNVVAATFATAAAANAIGQGECWITGNGTDESSVVCSHQINLPTPLSAAITFSGRVTRTVDTTVDWDIVVGITTGANDTQQVYSAIVAIDPGTLP